MKKKNLLASMRKTEFDYEEDPYDKLLNMKKSKKDFFTNKAKMKKAEFDYEEDPYEPEVEEE